MRTNARDHDYRACNFCVYIWLHTSFTFLGIFIVAVVEGEGHLILFDFNSEQNNGKGTVLNLVILL